MDAEKQNEKLEVFLVEDCELDAKLITRAFSAGDFETDLTISPDGESALISLMRMAKKPNLIILDLKIPKVDGFEFIGEIKKVTSLKQIPIIVLTSSKSKGDFEKSTELGADCYITKPQSLEEYHFIIKSIENFWKSLHNPLKKSTEKDSEEYSLLIVEDHEATIEIISNILRRKNNFGNFKFKIAKTLNSAISQLSIENYDAIILDLKLPDAENLSALNALSTSYPHIPIIVLTSDAREDLPLECFNNNADEFISKSDLNVRNLAKTLRLAIIRRQMSIKLAQHRLQASVEQARIESISRSNMQLVHEIRTPLSLIIIKADEISEEIRQKKMESKSVDKSLTAINDAVQKINKIIRFSLVYSNDYSEEQASLADINQMVRKAIDASEYSLLKFGVSYDLQQDFSNPIAKIREGQIIQAIINIITNACGAISDQTEKWIKVAVKTIEDNILISITDSGHGIDGEISEKIFDAMFTTKKTGSGLGLPISKNFIEANGGHLSLNKESDNTQFIINLPKYTSSVRENEAC